MEQKLDLTSLKNATQALGVSLQYLVQKEKENISELEKEIFISAVIQRFKYTYELCWKMMKRWLKKTPDAENIQGVTMRELFRVAAKNGLIEDINKWYEFHIARNLSSHLYEDKVAKETCEIAKEFYAYAQSLCTCLEEKA